jgi:hypothetical protein
MFINICYALAYQKVQKYPFRHMESGFQVHRDDIQYRLLNHKLCHEEYTKNHPKNNVWLLLRESIEKLGIWEAGIV